MSVSVIIPAYNAEKFISECLDSVLSQSYSDIEVIVVDDGSTDSTPLILARYAAKDARISVIRQVNAGVSAARNRGIGRASGEKACFVDADDMLHPRCIEFLVDGTGKDDISVGDFIYSEKCLWQQGTPGRSVIMSPRNANETTLYQRGMFPTPCAKLFPTYLLKEVEFKEGLRYEDLEIMPRLYDRCKGNVAHIRFPVYFYRENPGSFIQRITADRLDVLKVVDMIEESYKNDPVLLRAARDRKFSANFNMFLLCSRAGLDKEAERCWQVVKAYRRESLANSKVRLKNRVGALLSYLGRRPVLMVSKLV